MSGKNNFEKGLLVGMNFAGGGAYSPNIYNDDGVYSYFYIDFKKPVEDFSFGMFVESIIVYYQSQLKVTDVEKITAQKYKIYCDISDKPLGITVMGRESSFIYFTSGASVQAFSTMFQVAGIASSIRLKYIYEHINHKCEPTSVADSVGVFEFQELLDTNHSDVYQFVSIVTVNVDIPSVVLT